jgi:chromosome segregation ATPase
VRAHRKEFDLRLEDTLNSLNRVMDSNDALVEERNEFEVKLRECILERDELERTLEDLKVEAQFQAQDISRESAQLAADEFARLVERLELAEKRAVEMSSNGARAFAKSARTIAYLEGECSHQASLVDHFRGVNAKLTNDLKVTNEEALRAKGLEHRYIYWNSYKSLNPIFILCRLNMASENEIALLNRISTLEHTVRSKEKELLLSFHSSQNQEEMRTEKFEAEIRELGEKLKSAKEKIMSLSKELKASTESYEAKVATLTEDVSFSKEQVSYAEQDKIRMQNSVEELEVLSASLKTQLRMAEERIVELESQTHLLSQDKLVFGDAFEKRKTEFDVSMQDKSRRIRELENQMNTLKRQLSEAEASNILKDDVISSALNKQSALTDDTRSLRAKVDGLITSNKGLLQTTDERRSQHLHTTDDLTTLKSLYSDLKGSVLPDALAKLQHAEESQRYACAVFCDLLLV